MNTIEEFNSEIKRLKSINSKKSQVHALEFFRDKYKIAFSTSIYNY